MEAAVTVEDIVIRLLAATMVGAVIGFDRGTRGRVAGLRTTVLICLAAAGAMIEANLTLGVTGKSTSSFSMMDPLRFPLGILSGIGFIGAGAILKRGNLVTGVTTAATLWLVTVIGLALGGGYFVLGGCLALIAFLVLTVLVRAEPLVARDQHANLSVRLADSSLSTEELRSRIAAANYKVGQFSIVHMQDRLIRCRVSWRSRKGPDDVPPLVEDLASQPGVLSVGWEPLDAGQHAD